VLIDGDLTLWDAQVILAYLGEKTGKKWPTSMAGRLDALRWLFFLSGHLTPPAGEVANRVRSKVLGVPLDEAMVARGEKALPAVIGVVEGQLAKGKWMLGDDFTLVDCAYCSILNVIEKAGFSLGDFPKVRAYLDAMRSRTAWQKTPKLPGCRENEIAGANGGRPV
jgi:glutathione S-transferase